MNAEQAYIFRHVERASGARESELRERPVLEA